jgi:hypothetical protein
VTFFYFWWRSFLGHKSVGVSLRYYWKWWFMAILTKMGVIWPFFMDQRLQHLTPHVFPSHRSHSWISGGDHFLVKNMGVLAFGIIENCRSWPFSTKMSVVWTLIIDQKHVHLTRHMFPCHRSHSWISGADHSLVKKYVGVSLRYYWKWSFIAIFDKNGGWIVIHQGPKARTPHPTYVSLP